MLTWFRLMTSLIEVAAAAMAGKEPNWKTEIAITITVKIFARKFLCLACMIFFKIEQQLLNALFVYNYQALSNNLSLL